MGGVHHGGGVCDGGGAGEEYNIATNGSKNLLVSLLSYARDVCGAREVCGSGVVRGGDRVGECVMVWQMQL